LGLLCHIRCIVHAQVREWGWATGGSHRVQREQFFQQDAKRPTIKRNMVAGQEKDVILRRTGKEVRSVDRPAFQLKWPVRFICKPSVELFLVPGGGICDREGDFLVRVDLLDRPAVIYMVRRADGRMAVE
jgi:hypothetical protein